MGDFPGEHPPLGTGPRPTAEAQARTDGRCTAVEPAAAADAQLVERGPVDAWRNERVTKETEYP